MPNNMLRNYNAAVMKKSGGMCLKKTVKTVRANHEGIATYTVTHMKGETVDQTFAHKVISIDDDVSMTKETFEVRSNDNRWFAFEDCGLTRYRCAEMTSLAIKLVYPNKLKRVGFIGNGPTNLLNCIAIKRDFGVNSIVLRGSPRNYAKNVGDFMTVCKEVSVDTSEDMRLLNECDIVVVCTSSCTKDAVISHGDLKGPRLILTLDSGFYIGESFRTHRTSFSDFPEQIMAHYADEFPFDEEVHQFEYMRKLEDGEEAVVYLYGVSIADAVAAERLVERLKEDGMEKPFLKE